MNTIIKLSSYTETFPMANCNVKVAIKTENWNNNKSIKTEVFGSAIYDSGFVSIDGGEKFYMAGNFLFHKMKRTK